VDLFLSRADRFHPREPSNYLGHSSNTCGPSFPQATQKDLFPMSTDISRSSGHFPKTCEPNPDAHRPISFTLTLAECWPQALRVRTVSSQADLLLCALTDFYHTRNSASHVWTFLFAQTIDPECAYQNLFSRNAADVFAFKRADLFHHNMWIYSS